MVQWLTKGPCPVEAPGEWETDWEHPRLQELVPEWAHGMSLRLKTSLQRDGVAPEMINPIMRVLGNVPGVAQREAAQLETQTEVGKPS